MKHHLYASVLLSLVAALGACTGDIAPDNESASVTSYDLGQSDLRIAVVGAGASGLTAAHTLEALGYQNVTVFEKEDHVGGKISSLKIGDVRAELGAVFTSPDYKLVLGLADQYFIPYVTYQVPRFILDRDTHDGKLKKFTFQEFLTNRYSVTEIQTAVQNYAAALQTFAQIEQDGFANLPADLDLTFDKFAAKHGFVPVAELAKSLMIGFGYGYYETVPAAYIMKLLPWLVKIGPNGLESPPYYVFPNGFQGLWQAVAADLDVRLNSAVTQIEKSTSDHPVLLTINFDSAHKQEFDVVIVSAPLNTVPWFVNLSSAERALFAKVETNRYFVSLFGALNLPLGETVFIQDNARPGRIDHASVWGNPGGNLPVFIAYQLANKWTPTALINFNLILDILTLGGGVASPPIIQKEWEYFPHVGTAALAAGFYEQMEALQGQGGIYYVGSGLSFETVEHTSRFAKSLVENYFPAAAIAASN